MATRPERVAVTKNVHVFLEMKLEPAHAINSVLVILVMKLELVVVTTSVLV